MIVKPLYIMERIFGLLKTSSKISFHSSFQNSFNLKIDNLILNVSTNLTTLPPFGIVLSEDDFLYVKDELEMEDVEIKINDNKICINNAIIIIEDEIENYNSNIIMSKNLFSEEIIDQLKDIVLLSGKQNGFNLDNEILLNRIINDTKWVNIGNYKDKYMEVFLEKLNELRLFFQGNDILYRENICEKDMYRLTNIDQLEDYKSDIEAVKYFLGRGMGLTPSGDDFLVGAMALFYSVGEFKSSMLKIRSFILENIGIYTNDISEQFLILGSEGLFSKSIIVLIEELKCNKIYITTINNVIKYGGTSGIDIMLGIIWANTILEEAII